MQLRIGNIEMPGNQLYLTLDDGRIVHISGHGDVAVYRPETRGLGTEDYSLNLPTVEYVAAHCDAQGDVMHDGRVTIEVTHRH